MARWRWIIEPTKWSHKLIKIAACRLWKADKITAYPEEKTAKAA